MRDALIIFFSLIAAIVIGGSLYLYGSPALYINYDTKKTSGTRLTVLAEGQNAANFDSRVNYRITNQADLQTLWSMLYADNGPLVPTIDFTKDEVLAVFDGSHSSGGFGIHVTDVNDADGKRVIHILRSVPDDRCTTPSAITSPYEIVSLSKSELPLTHVDDMATSSCSQ